MATSIDRPLNDARSRTRWALGTAGFSLSAILLDIVSIAALSTITGLAYHFWAYGNAGEIGNYTMVGGLAALCYVMPFAFRNEYRIHDYLDGRRSFGRTFVVWNTTFLCLAVIGFLTKTTGIFSRVWMLLFYVAGLSTLTALNGALSSVLSALIGMGRIASRRILLVGAEDEIRRIMTEIERDRTGARIAAIQVLPPQAADGQSPSTELKPALAAAVDKARALGVDDVVLLIEWSRSDLIHEVVEAFTVVPVSIHLGASGLLGRFSDARVSRFAAMTALSLTAPPLGPMQVVAKRTFDMLMAGMALVLLAPLFGAIAIGIKTTSPGPVFFRQRRRGYNSHEFRIWKFRTMTTLDDGAVIHQAKENDARVTALGRYLRRFNLDELPQLINVVRGEMSLVGPRPHAVAHDIHYEERIGSYPRRLNVLPGITGWAQVNGFRGRTETDEAMRARVEFDLYYIDNWSILFDLYIIALTVLSPKAYRNAH